MAAPLTPRHDYLPGVRRAKQGKGETKGRRQHAHKLTLLSLSVCPSVRCSLITQQKPGPIGQRSRTLLRAVTVHSPPQKAGVREVFAVCLETSDVLASSNGIV